MLLRTFTSLLVLPYLLVACSGMPEKRPEHVNAQMSQAIDVPDQAVKSFQIAINLIADGSLDEAEKALMQLTVSYPQLSGPYANLGVIYTKKGDLKKAENLFKLALVKNENNADAWNQLGVVYREDGKFKDARDAYEKALKINPNMASAYFNLGILLDLYLGDIHSAADNYRKYQALTGNQDTSVAGWLVDIDRRIKSEGRQVASDGGRP